MSNGVLGLVVSHFFFSFMGSWFSVFFFLFFSTPFSLFTFVLAPLVCGRWSDTQSRVTIREYDSTVHLDTDSVNLVIIGG